MLEINFSDEQIAILDKVELKTTASELQALFLKEELIEEELAILLRAANALYREGKQALKDSQYDAYISQ